MKLVFTLLLFLFVPALLVYRAWSSWVRARDENKSSPQIAALLSIAATTANLAMISVLFIRARFFSMSPAFDHRQLLPIFGLGLSIASLIAACIAVARDAEGAGLLIPAAILPGFLWVVLLAVGGTSIAAI